MAFFIYSQEKLKQRDANIRPLRLGHLLSLHF
jgi:hypothetical protein